VTAEVIPFNPLDKHNLGASVAEAMLNKPVEPLGELKAFKGAGIYAIYYSGQHPAYAALTAQTEEGPVFPIYVGKAIPAGGRKGVSIAGIQNTQALFNRLREHAESIRATALGIGDFSCRYLVVEDIWIPLGEALLIAKFSLVWNVLIDGFGNHDPGAGRYQGLQPRWDVLHPGRQWAPKCRPREETEDGIMLEVQNHLSNSALPKSPHVLRGE
jgi:Eco29kI restriction endonuclease